YGEQLMAIVPSVFAPVGVPGEAVDVVVFSGDTSAVPIAMKLMSERRPTMASDQMRDALNRVTDCLEQFRAATEEAEDEDEMVEALDDVEDALKRLKAALTEELSSRPETA